MAGRSKFYDQDEEGRRQRIADLNQGSPRRARRGMLYDQDATGAHSVISGPVGEPVYLGPRPPLVITSRPTLTSEVDRDYGNRSRRGRFSTPHSRVQPDTQPTPQPASRSTGQSTREATAVLAAGTFASRISGFLRVLVVAYVLGVGPLSDAYNYANGIPNIVYDLMVGGVLSATLIPVFVEHLRGRDRDATRAISAVVTAIGAVLVGVSVVLWFAAPWVIRFYLLLNPVSVGHSEHALATELLRYFAPQVFFIGAIVVSTALLNARRSFTAAAVSPVVNNLIAIAALLITKGIASSILTSKTASAAGTLAHFQHDMHAIWVLGIGTTAGYAVQFLVQLPAMRRAGLRVRLVWDPMHPAVRQVLRLSTWLVGVVLTNQIALAVVMILAGRTEGGVTAYQFSYQFFQLPYALVAVSIASALMPNLAERWSEGDHQGFERQFAAGLRVTMAVLVPAGLAYAAVAQPFIQLAVHHGRVSGSGAHLVSSTLALFAIGLPGFSAFFLLMRVYQAMQDARSMFRLYAIENALTVVAALALDPLLGVPGLALAWVGPYTIASLIAARDLRRRVGRFGGAATAQALVRIAVAGGIAAGTVALVGALFPGHETDPVILGRLLAQAAAGTIVYIALARLMKLRELRPILQIARRLLR